MNTTPTHTSIDDEGQQAVVVDVFKAIVAAAGFPVDSVSVETMAEQKVFSVSIPDGASLVGPRGETLRSLEFLVKRIAESKGVLDEHYTIDVNKYRAQQIQELQQRAKMMAERAKSFQYDVELPPMSGYERLIIHSTLSNTPSIKTESAGEGKNRRVVIKYVAI